jgi:hypothetical protein
VMMGDGRVIEGTLDRDAVLALLQRHSTPTTKGSDDQP